MPKLLSSYVHGFLDYTTVALLFVLARRGGFSREVRSLLRVSAFSTLIYSLFTRYEHGAIRLLPMRVHLALDGLSGAMFVGAPAILQGEEAAVRSALLGSGCLKSRRRC